MLCQALLSEAFFPLCCLAIFGKEDVGGEAEGGSKRSERSEAEPGEKGESRSMSTGEPELLRGGEECCLKQSCCWLHLPARRALKILLDLQWQSGGHIRREAAVERLPAVQY